MDKKETRAVNRGREILRLGSLRRQEFLHGLTPQSYSPSPGLSRNKDKPPPQLAGLNKRGGVKEIQNVTLHLCLFLPYSPIRIWPYSKGYLYKNSWVISVLAGQTPTEHLLHSMFGREYDDISSRSQQPFKGPKIGRGPGDIITGSLSIVALS